MSRHWAMALVCGLVWSLSGPVHAALLYEETAEDGVLQAHKIMQSCGTTCGQWSIVTSPSRTGTKSVRMELKRTDGPGQGNMKHRLEIVPRRPSETGLRWYGFSIFVPNDWTPDPNWEILLQWHTNWDLTHDGNHPDGEEPPLGLIIAGNNWLLYDKNWKNPQRTLWQGPVTKNAWTDWVLQVTWAATPTGSITLWQQGRVVYTGQNRITSFSGEAFLEFGVYKWGWSDPNTNSTTSKRVYFYDNIAIGDAASSYAEVNPARGVTPPPDRTAPKAPGLVAPPKP